MKKLLTISVLFFFFTNSSIANSQEAATKDEIKTFISNLGSNIIDIAKNKKDSEKVKNDKIIKVVDDSIDSNWISRFVLGKSYSKLSDSQKSQFSELYRQFMINTYAPKFRDYNGRKFTVLSIEKQKIFYVVRCEFLPATSDVAISFDFRVRSKNGKLSVIDFVAEGISLIESQRSEFNSVISSKGVETFLVELEERVNNLKSRKFN